jgi:hypothetical protein
VQWRHEAEGVEDNLPNIINTRSSNHELIPPREHTSSFQTAFHSRSDLVHAAFCRVPLQSRAVR